MGCLRPPIRWGHFWGHTMTTFHKPGKVDSDHAPTTVQSDKDTKPSKLSSPSS
jgi:hypothetical protein